MDIISIGTIFILLGFALVFFGTLFQGLKATPPTEKGNVEKSNVKFSFVGLIGPFPFGFGNDQQMFLFTLTLAIVLMVLLMLFFGKPLR